MQKGQSSRVRLKRLYHEKFGSVKRTCTTKYDVPTKTKHRRHITECRASLIDARLDTGAKVVPGQQKNEVDIDNRVQPRPGTGTGQSVDQRPGRSPDHSGNVSRLRQVQGEFDLHLPVGAILSAAGSLND